MSRSALAASVRYLRKLVASQCHPTDSDERLLHSFVVGRDEAAFAALVHRYGPMVAGVCRRVLGHEQDAEDALQATFLVLAQKAAHLREKASLAGFLHGIAYRIALNAKRAAARRRKHEGQVPARPSVDPADELSWREVRALVDEEVARLPEKYRSAFILCCLESVSQAEAAQRLGLKEGTLSSRLTAARKLLSQRLARRGVELTAALAASALSTQPASALLPLSIATTIEAAVATAGAEGTAGLVSVHVASLMNGAAPAAILSKAKIVTVVLLSVSVLAGAAAWSASANRWKLSAEAPPAAFKPPLPLVSDKTAPRQMDSEIMTVKGRVLGPDGKPIRGARLYSARNPRPLLRADADAVAAPAQAAPTDAAGRFQVLIKKADSDKCVYLIAHAAGFGLDWIDLNEEEQTSEVTLRLVKDVPIAGRVVNTEGRPVAGVSVSISAVWTPANEKLDDYLNGWLRSPSYRALFEVRKFLFARLDAVSPAATTDKDGRFSLSGVGGERIVPVAFTGGGVAHRTLFVITRPGFDAKPYIAALRSNRADRRLVESDGFLGLYPPQLTFVAETGKVIEGVVKDADTGKPLAGCQVFAERRFDPWSTAVTNDEGKYRLEGLAQRSSFYDVWVDPPKRSLYLYRRDFQQVADTVRFTPIRWDFALVKGALVTGRVVDKQTGKGVRCRIDSTPLPGNKFFASKLASARRNEVASRVIEASDDGRFRLVAIPGPSLLTARVVETVKSHGAFLWVYRKAVPDPEHKDKFIEFRGSWRIQTADDGFEYLGRHNAVKVIDVKGNGETRVELSVDPGATARIVVQDADGKPLPGALAAGLSEMRPTRLLREATATVYALNQDEPRQMAFFHAAKKLGGTAMVRGDEKQPIVVKLAPLGKVSGRVLDKEGQPLKGVEVSIVPQSEIGEALYNNIGAPPVYTDQDGRFHIENVVPNLRFWVSLRKDRVLDSEPDLDDKQIKPGETIDFGDVRVKPAD